MKDSFVTLSCMHSSRCSTDPRHTYNSCVPHLSGSVTVRSRRCCAQPTMCHDTAGDKVWRRCDITNTRAVQKCTPASVHTVQNCFALLQGCTLTAVASGLGCLQWGHSGPARHTPAACWWSAGQVGNVTSAAQQPLRRQLSYHVSNRGQCTHGQSCASEISACKCHL